jgi:hypothetical protein
MIPWLSDDKAHALNMSNYTKLLLWLLSKNGYCRIIKPQITTNYSLGMTVTNTLKKGAVEYV